MPEHADSGIDFDGLVARVGEDNSFVEELIGLFLTDVPAKLADLVRAIENGEAARVEKIAHSLKGTSATVKATAFETAALELELSARALDVEKWEPLADQLRNEFSVIELQATERGIEPRDADSTMFGAP